MKSRTLDIALRGTAAACALASAVLHLILVPSHLEEKPYIGVLFVVGSVPLLLVAAGLVVRRRPLGAWAVGALVSLGMITGFLLSRTVGLPGYYEPDWEPPYGVLSLIVEAVFLVALPVWLTVTGIREPTGTRADLRAPEASRPRAGATRLHQH
ncbi:hypothetical protein F7Q99_37145 [Streptomyces kaniharaensis]|uniref:Uncharacterized protein n=1 Tax=Streptomyces kaniharaensis TaxID=212423 RepID=A0A6N7L4T0_9ACTN|nr:hypothetical protein [Streptomyces kaniharaensis]MQS17668.1 hypothetical protein [Streptomyces kaniharaensis]